MPAALAAAAMPVEMPASPPIEQALNLQNDLFNQRQQLNYGAAGRADVSLRSGQNEIVQIARGHLNRFVTPFANPVFKGTDSLTVGSVEGSIVYVATTSNSAVTMFIVDEDNPVNAFNLTLVPREMPAISMTLKLDGYAAGVTASVEQAERFEASNDFVAVLRESFRSLAQGEVPSGFGLRQFGSNGGNRLDCLMPGLKVEPAQEIAGHQLVIVVAKVTNTTRIPQSVDETACGSDRVLAVAAWPYVELLPGQSTEMFVALRRSAPPAANARPSLLR